MTNVRPQDRLVPHWEQVPSRYTRDGLEGKLRRANWIVVHLGEPGFVCRSLQSKALKLCRRLIAMGVMSKTVKTKKAGLECQSHGHHGRRMHVSNRAMTVTRAMLLVWRKQILASFLNHHQAPSIGMQWPGQTRLELNATPNYAESALEIHWSS